MRCGILIFKTKVNKTMYERTFEKIFIKLYVSVCKNKKIASRCLITSGLSGLLVRPNGKMVLPRKLNYTHDASYSIK